MNPEIDTLLPSEIFGAVSEITPIRLGLSGAGLYAASTDRGEYVLRVTDSATPESTWEQRLTIWRRAAEVEVAPAIAHVDVSRRAIVAVRVNGTPLSALGDPSQREAAVRSVVEQLRTLHAIDPRGVEALDAVALATGAWESQRDREGFPSWVDAAPPLAQIADVLSRDTRRVVGHNDMNPGNVLWDGRRAWLVDWDVAALAHPFYDVATFATFLNLDADAGLGLLALQERRAIEDAERVTFAALRTLTAIAVGFTLLGLVPDLRVRQMAMREDAPTLAQCYADMRTGALDLQTPLGRATFALAFLRLVT